MKAKPLPPEESIPTIRTADSGKISQTAEAVEANTLQGTLPQQFGGDYVPRPELEAQVRRLFATPENGGENARMVTLWGSPGIGKTRLAIACAQQMANEFPDGVCFASLEGRSASALSLIEAIGQALKLDRPASLDDLLPALRDKTLLLVLDGYDNMRCPDTEAFLLALLRGMRRLRLLLTSREPLHIADMEKTVEVKGMTEEQATEFFIASVRRYPKRESWQPKTTKDQQALHSILELTDQHPFILAMLAAEVASLTISDVAEHLATLSQLERPKSHDDTNPLFRRQSLQSLLDRSFSLLEDTQKYSVACLNLFVDTFDALTVEAVLCLPETSQLLDRLSKGPFLTRRNSETEYSRYTIPLPFRNYLIARFNALSDAAELRSRYVAYYCQLVIDNHDINDLKKQAALKWEWRNAIAASDYTEDTASICTIAERLTDYLLLRGLWSEAELLNEKALTVAQGEGNRPAEGRALNNLGNVYQQTGRLKESLNCYQQSRNLLRECGDRVGEMRVLNNLSNVYQSQQRWQEAIECYDQYRKQLQEGDSVQSVGQIYNSIGNLDQSHGRWQEAEKDYRLSIVFLRQCGDRIGEGRVLGNLGNVLRSQGRLQKAEECCRESLSIQREYGDQLGIGQALYALAELLIAQDKSVEALPHLREAIEIFREVGATQEQEKAQKALQSAEAQAALREANRLISEGAWQRGLNTAREVLEQFRAIDDKRGKAGAFLAIGDAHFRFGDYEIALMNYKDAERHFRQAADERGAVYARFKMGTVETMLDDMENASAHLREAAGYFREHSEETLAQMGEHLLELATTNRAAAP